jgi:hypothetical protein
MRGTEILSNGLPALRSWNNVVDLERIVRPSRPTTEPTDLLTQHLLGQLLMLMT